MRPSLPPSPGNLSDLPLPVAALLLPVAIAFLSGCSTALPAATTMTDPTDGPDPDWHVATYSIVAADPETGDMGVAVASRFLGVGAVVPYAKAGVGAIATQSRASAEFGPKGLRLLAEGATPEEVLAVLLRHDPHAADRQVAVMDAKGRTAQHTGGACTPWCGHKAGKNFAVQGNLLAGPAVVDDMATAFEKAEGTLAERMLAALDAAEAAGGDKRGRQSAAILVVRDRPFGHGPWGFGDRWMDLRVDDHAKPLEELRRLVGVHGRLFRWANRPAVPVPPPPPVVPPVLPPPPPPAPPAPPGEPNRP